MNRDKSIILLSGGIDSAVILEMLLKQGRLCIPLFIDYGQASRQKEKEAAHNVSKHYGLKLKTITVNLNKGFKDGEVLGRNLFLITTALIDSTDETSIAIGIHSGTSYYDCSPKFISSTKEILSNYTSGTVGLLSPLINWSKSEILTYAISNNVPIEKTYSCEQGEQEACGRCLSCKDRELLNACEETNYQI